MTQDTLVIRTSHVAFFVFVNAALFWLMYAAAAWRPGARELLSYVWAIAWLPSIYLLYGDRARRGFVLTYRVVATLTMALAALVIVL